MPRNWLQIEVEMLGGRDIDCDPPPGRVFIVGPSHTFAQLADAIDAALARWDLSHLHEFELADGRRVGFPDVDPDEHGWLDHAALKVAGEVEPGDEFRYVFDLGDDWRHRCRVLDEKVDRARSGATARCQRSPCRSPAGAGSRPVRTGDARRLRGLRCGFGAVSYPNLTSSGRS